MKELGINQCDLVSLIAADLQLSSLDVDRVLSSLFTKIPELVDSGKVVSIKRFGQFRKVTLRARPFINFDGQKREVPERETLRFRAFRSSGLFSRKKSANE